MSQSKEPDNLAHAPPAAAAAPAEAYVHDNDTNAGLIALVGALATVGVLLIVILLHAWFYNWKEDIAGAKALPPGDPRTPLGRALVEQEEQLGSYHWINREARVQAIPIQRAMELVAAEMSEANKPEASHGK
ncbi:MAG: hypothetical protein ABSG68_03930 [Thermoguttaceae bacterium]